MDCRLILLVLAFLLHATPCGAVEAAPVTRPATRPATQPVVVEKTARATLTAVELDVGDELRFRLSDGTVRRIVLESAFAQVMHTTAEKPKAVKPGTVTVYRFGCTFTIDGLHTSIVREVGTQKSFYEPRELMGVRIWLDACDDIFDFLNEKHGRCRPGRRVRFAIQEAGARICPVLLHPWCPLPEGGLKIEDCYNGENVWMGGFWGGDAHGGLDLNHPAGTPIWAPFSFDDHLLFNSLAQGNRNNRWRGYRRWADGSTWVLQVHHVIRLRVPPHTPVEAGTLLADGAGVAVGEHEHSHFVFKVIEPGATEQDAILLDPWILFWQMYRDRQLTTGR